MPEGLAAYLAAVFVHNREAVRVFHTQNYPLISGIPLARATPQMFVALRESGAAQANAHVGLLMGRAPAQR